jgi:hypothetical protein
LPEVSRAAKGASPPAWTVHCTWIWYSRARAREEKINLARRGRINLAVNADHATFEEPLAPRNRGWEAS